MKMDKKKNTKLVSHLAKTRGARQSDLTRDTTSDLFTLVTREILLIITLKTYITCVRSCVIYHRE